MPNVKDRPYPAPGKNPDNTPAPPRLPREEIARAVSVINREMYRLELTAMSKVEESYARALRGLFKETIRRLRVLRAERFEDGRYDEFEGK